MASLANDDGDLGKHFVISRDISIQFKKEKKTSKRLDVIFNGDPVKATTSNTDDTDGLTFRWALDRELRMFTNLRADDTLTFRVSYGKRRGCFKAGNNRLEEFRLAPKDIADKSKDSQANEITFSGQNCSVTLKVTTGSIEEILATEPSEELDPLLHVQDVITSSNSFLQNAQPLKSILENIPISEEVLNGWEKTIGELANAHPLARAIFTALSIPYKLLKNEHEFKQNVKDLVEAMHAACGCLVDVRYHTKITSAKELFVSIMKMLRDAAVFVDTYEKKGWFKQVVGAQFPIKLEKYAEDLITLKNDFQIAMVMQIAVDAGKIESKISDDFIRKRLDPAKQEKLEASCLEGTRIKILDEVRDWLQDGESAENILWISGDPGAGKSTIATTIARELVDKSPSFAKFFCKRDVPHLRDPGHIWRTLACSLAVNHNGVKAVLMRTLDGKNSDPQDDSAFDQFQTLIKRPLTTALEETGTGFRVRRSPQAVIIIDALDECRSVNDESWKSFLKSLVGWAALPSLLKLIVTSRVHFDLREALGKVSHSIDISTGNYNSASDIRTFLSKKFAEIRKEFGLSSDWPSEAAIQEMTDYAAGLFIWADMVVKYVGQVTGGGIPNERLKRVLADIQAHPGHQRGGINALDGPRSVDRRVDRLYAWILFEAFRDSTPNERSNAKRILATVVLAKVPLRKCDLVELLSTDSSDLNDVLASIESILRVLVPIIPVPNADSEGQLRVCHKTVSDFLLSYDNSAAAMEDIVHDWNLDRRQKKWNGPVSDLILDCAEENNCLALACLHLARRKLSLDVVGVAELLKRSDRLLYYVHQYWFEHLDLAGISCQWIPNLKILADAMKVAHGCLQRLQRHAQGMWSANEEAVALTEHLRDSANFASQRITNNPNSVERTVVDLQRGVEEHAKRLDTARGNFQIAMVLKLASDIDKSAPDAPDAFLRKRLVPSSQSLLDDECLEGTRTNVLRKAKDWLVDPELPNILWIFGAPGAGKSAIATTLVRELSDERLCAKFSAKRDIADRRDPKCVWRTLAFNLAGLHTGLKGSIMEALSDMSHSESASVEARFHDLVVKAMEDQQCLSVVVVIDALDECYTEDNEDWRWLLQTVASWADLPWAFRLVITSRDIPDIRSILAEVSHPISLTTGKEASIDAKTDTQLFFRTKFAEMRKDIMPSEWPGEDVIRRLTEFAAGSFIWAKMVVEMVKLDPVGGRLENILDGVGSVGNVDDLYGKMLFETLGNLHEKERNRSRSILAAMVLAKDPLRISDLVDLLPSTDSSVDETRRSVENVVEELSSIITVDDNQLLRIPHKSFSDFILDHNRSSAAMRCLVPVDQELRSYIIDRQEHSANIVIGCLTIMNNSLKFNICGINSSHCLNDDIPELQALMSNNISTLLIYACRFWAEHLKDSPRRESHLRTVQPLLKMLLYEKALYWLEVLSLVKDIASAKESLLAAADFLEGHDNDFKLAEVARDAAKFTSEFEVPIAVAATHIYLSALTFCPSDSFMSRTYGPQYPNLLSVTSGRRVNWDTVAAIIDCHSGLITSLAFFPDGKKLASGSLDKTVRIWDSKTGKAISAPLTGHTSFVWSVAVSPDGKLVASGSDDGTLRIWDSNTGACPLGPIAAHSNVIRSVAFSPDSSRIITGSVDCTAKVWNVATGDLCLGPLTSDVISVAFSPDGTCIASGSDDGTIRIWDASTGESRREPLIGHSDLVNCVAFSANGHYLASASNDEMICLWDVTQGFAEVATATLASSVTSVSFSPNSTCLVSISFDGALRFWDISSGSFEQLGEAIYGHSSSSGFVRSVAFSPDGLSVASCSTDGSIKMWTVPTTTSTRTPDVPGTTGKSPIDVIPFDRHRFPVLSDASFIDEDGWMYDSKREDHRRLFWVPEANRAGFWWPRNTAVIARTVTKIDFTRFVHGNNWVECRLQDGQV